MLRTLLFAVGVGLSAGIYIPTFRRLRRRKASRDFSQMAQGFIVAIQVNGFILATAEHARYLECWYILQILLTLAQFAVIRYYWNSVPPLMRGEKQ